MNILMVLTSHDQLGASGKKTGLWLEEFAAPYYELTDAGATVVLASPKGGQAPIDPTSDEAAAQTDATARYHADPATQKLLAHTERLSEVNASSFSAVFYPGGHGPLWDLVDDKDSLALLRDFDAEGKPIAAVCHAPIALKNLMTDAGGYFLDGRNVTGFSNSEESAVGLTDVVPELLEDVLIERRAHYSKGAVDFQPYVIVDGTLITGQNPASSAEAAATLLMMLAVGHQ